MMFCPCNIIEEVGSGGIVSAGSAIVSGGGSTVGGGVKCGGVALVDGPGVYDGLAGMWPLDEFGLGLPNEYKDRSINGLHGTGGEGDQLPELEDGVHCLWSQHLDGRQFITVPKDPIKETAAFCVSCWGKIEGFYQGRSWFSRGYSDTDGNNWVFSLGHSFINTALARVQTLVDGEPFEYQAFSQQELEEDKFYHFACVFIPGQSLTVFVNGVEEASVEVPELATVDYNNSGYIGRFGDGMASGNVQELRLHSEIRNADWFRSEYKNFCDPSFYSATVPLTT